MLTLIMGQNGSGKSRFAETYCHRLGGRLIYIATMQPVGEEGAKRVQKHRRQREGLGFLTIEAPVGPFPSVNFSDIVLLEDLSNLLANHMFMKDGGILDAYNDVFSLNKACRSLVVVTISGLNSENITDSGTKEYILALNKLNEMLLKDADLAIKMVDGNPKAIKGELKE